MSNVTQLADQILPHILKRLERLPAGGGAVISGTAQEPGTPPPVDLNAGAGIDITADVISVDLASPSGLMFTFGTERLAISDALAGAGLNIASKVMSVDTAHSFTWTGQHTFQQNVQVAADIVFQGNNRKITTQSNNNFWLAPSGTGKVMLPEYGTDIRTEGAISNFLGKGWQLNNDDVGWSHLDIRSIYAEELHVTAFIADTARVQVGETFLANSMALVADVEDWEFVIPAVGNSTKLYVEDVPDIAGQVFDDSGSGDWVMLRFIDREGGGLKVGTVWGQVTNYNAESGIDGVQSYTFTTRQGSLFVGHVAKMGSLVIGFGRSGSSFIHTSVIANDAPWQRMMVWEGANPYTPANRTLLVQTGNLSGITDSVLNPTGHGLYATNTFLKGKLQTANTMLDNTGITMNIGVKSDWSVDDGLKWERSLDDALFASIHAYHATTTPVNRLRIQTHSLPGLNEIRLDALSPDGGRSDIVLQAESVAAPFEFNTTRVRVLSGATFPSRIEIQAREILLMSGGGGATDHVRSISLRPATTMTYDLGTPTHQWRAIYVDELVAGTITGEEALGGQIWQYDDSNMIVRSNSSSDRTLFLSNTGGGTMNLDVQGSILVGGSVDGVDISIFFGSYNTHVGNANAHHNAATGGDGINVSGGQAVSVDGTVVRTSRAVLSGVGLSGGGDLSANRTLSVDQTFGFTWTAQHAFNRTVAGAPFTLNANAQGQTVVGLRADQLNKSISPGNGLTGGGLLTENRTLTAVGHSGIAVSASGIAVDLASNPGLGFASAQLHVLAGDGLQRDGTGLHVHLASNPGLEFATAQLRVRAGAGLARDATGVFVDLASNPGLGFDAGQLHVLDGAGLVRDATGLHVDLAANSGLTFFSDVQLAMGVPSLVTATSSNVVSTDTHTHQVDHSFNPGAARKLLSSSVDGVLILPRFGVNTTPSGASLDVRAQVTGHHSQRIRQIPNQTGRLWRIEDQAGSELIVLDSVGNLQSGQPGFVSGLTGWRISPQGNVEFNDGWFRGELHASVFVMDEFHATGGTLFVATAGTLKNEANIDTTGQSGRLRLRSESPDFEGQYYGLRSAEDLTDDFLHVRTAAVTLDVEDPPSGAAILFPVGTTIRTKTFNGTGVFDLWFRVNSVERVDDEFYRYWCSKMSGTDTTLPAGTALVSYGQMGDGRILLTSDLQNAPYIDIFTRGGHEPWTGNAGEILPHVRLGRLDGVGVPGVSGVEQYGLIAGTDLSDANSPYLIASNLQLAMNRIDATWSDGVNQTGLISASGELRFGPNIGLDAQTGFRFDPVTGNLQIGSPSYPGSVTVYGSLVLPSGDPATFVWRGNWAPSTSYAAGDVVFHNGSSWMTRVPHTSGGSFASGNFDLLASEGDQGPTGPTGATGPTGPQGPPGADNQDFPFLEANTAAMSGKPAGAYVTADALGFWTGTVFRTYLDAGGNFFFGGSSGARLQYVNSNSRLSGFNSSNVVQWYADGTDGKIYAGAGNVVLDADGINIVASTAFATDRGYTFVSSGTAFAGMSGSKTGSAQGINVSAGSIYGADNINTNAFFGAASNASFNAISELYTLRGSDYMFVKLWNTTSDRYIEIGGPIQLAPQSAPPTPPTSRMRMYFNATATALIIQYRDGGTTRYKYLDLSGTGTTWQHSTTAP